MMKRYILFLILLCASQINAYAQNTTENYVLTIIPKIATSSSSELTDINSIRIYQYYDGLGRPSQTVQQSINPLKSDLVIQQEYNAFGREMSTWLPVVAANNNGSLLPMASLPTKSYTTYSDTKAYVQTEYETSPLSRPVAKIGSGENWHNNNKKTVTSYLSNNSVDYCRLYTSIDIRDSIQINSTGNYATGELFVIYTIDEDEKNATITFKDKLGQLLLTRQLNSTVAHDTYYIYDTYGNLRVVLPPLAADALTTVGVNWTWAINGADILSQYAYLYKYDHRNRCIARKLPGAEWIYYVYDDADRIVFTQDGETRAQGKWMFSIADAVGREVLRGTCTNTLNYSANVLTGKVAKATRNNATDTYKGYTLSDVTLSGAIVLSVNYYDDYDFMGKNNIPASSDANFTYETVNGYGTRYTDSSKGLLTGVMEAQINQSGVNTSFLYSVLYYDNRGRMIQTKSNNHLNGIEKEFLAYNFTGQPTAKLRMHSNSGSSTINEKYTYVYDHAGRLKETRHRLNDLPQVMVTSNNYDELGRLETTHRNVYTEN